MIVNAGAFSRLRRAHEPAKRGHADMQLSSRVLALDILELADCYPERPAVRVEGREAGVHGCLICIAIGVRCQQRHIVQF